MSCAKVSVIMPVYYGEKRLRVAIESVLNQTLQEIELWIVDDGSPDNSGKIADEYASKDPRVRVIHKENGGCYQARLSALMQIKTPYFTFVDQDDVADAQLCEKMLEFAEDNNLEIVQCDSSNTFKSEKDNELFLTRDDVIKKVVRPVLIEGNDQLTVWAKLYKNTYDFSKFDKTDHVTSFEDMIYNFQFYENVSRVGILHKNLYKYQVNDGSSIRNFSKRNFKDFNEAFRVRKIMLPRYGVGIKDAELINAKWCIKNVRNMLITASIAQARDKFERNENLRLILSMPVLKESMEILQKSLNIFNSRYLVVLLAKVMPYNVFSLLWRLVFKLRGQ